MAIWPSTLPKPLAGSYKLAPKDQVVRTDMETGYPRQRRRTEDRQDVLEVRWLFTDAQLATFRTWFDGDGEGGAAWFTIDMMVGNGGEESVSARFASPWAAELVGGPEQWYVSAMLEVIT